MADSKPLTSAKELLRRYSGGERAFYRVALRKGANLNGADLRGADLSNANLSGADFGAATLDGANLTRATLYQAFLGFAALSNANLNSADLRGADFSGANLSGANLNGADLRGAVLSGANVTNANLSGADLSNANLTNANLSGANLEGIKLSRTHLVEVELSPLCEARSTIVHLAPSTVDQTSILLSVRALGLKEFLAQTGMPEVFVEYMFDCARSLTTEVFKMLRSTFISYGRPDEPFARKLYEGLHRNGVTTFFFPEHAVPGDKLHRMVRNKLNELDRIVLVCSKASLKRKGVLNEIEETLDREARDGGAAYLIPIMIDDYVLKAWKPTNADVAMSVRGRVVADFRGADADPAKFQSALLRLIAALRK